MQREVGLLQVYAYQMVNTRGQIAFVTHPAHAVLLDFSLGFRQIHIYKGLTWMGFLPVEYDEDYITVQGVDERECFGNGTISITSELMP